MRSAWSLLPEDLSALGCGGDAAVLYGRLFRPWTWDAGGPALGRRARARLDGELDWTLPEIASANRSRDGATKVAFALADGARIESVHLPRAVRVPRVTLCLSTQVGCAMGCTFCATAGMGLVRNLAPHEIVGQALALCHALGPTRAQELTVVMMGMGEPLHNVEAVIRAIAILCAPEGLGLSPRRITVSTSGLVPGIDRLARATPRPLLALSLNATTDAARARTMPVTRTWGLAALRDALARWPLRPREKLTLEYVLLAGENDGREDAERLAAWARGLPHNLNVIPFNDFEGTLFREPTEASLRAFVSRLRELGCFVTVRRSRGRDVGAACGGLVQIGRRARSALNDQSAQPVATPSWTTSG